ncbi:ankyrin repeat domain-containing protein [Nocardioides mangrovicus]|uniref:Ankyrin repeat domain-containing protein n=1 Tax=Nocardioides mangrovicus TaxID=2478913 RepID=A0A3L8P6Y3_9ACTN|nr:ankyrin repeat domain-containing protein [Nocardioides mangrovicus]RLV50682.1 ankyrin repeat domain-containing protein [Nocardioides mangrovicus]
MPDHDPTHWRLPDHPSLEWLKRRAKRLRRLVDDGDPQALSLVERYDPGAGPVTLSRAQRVVARAHGYAGWSRLVADVRQREALSRPMAPTSDADDDVEAFLRAAVLSYTEPLAEPVPEPSRTTVHTLAALGRADELAAVLDADPSLVRAEGGPHAWVPLLYLCYSRVPQADAVGTLRLLLDRGADPDAGFLWQGMPSPFTALTGVLGGGERGEPPHPQAVWLATMLLDAGADPNDNQAFYNRAFEPDDSHLPPLLSHGAGHERPSPWRDRLGRAYPSPAQMVGEHLRSAAAAGFAQRVSLLLAAGVSPDTRGYHPVLGDATAYEVAVTRGQTECAALLADAGADTSGLDEDDLTLGRALAGTAEPGHPAVDGLPDRRPDAMRLAAELHGVAALEALVALGYDISTPGRWRTTALHEAALRGNEEMCRWLLERGASTTARDERFDATPAGWADHAGHAELAELLETDVD